MNFNNGRLLFASDSMDFLEVEFQHIRVNTRCDAYNSVSISCKTHARKTYHGRD